MKLPELDGRAIALAVPSTTAPTADGDSATPPCAPSSLSTSPSKTAASAGAVLLTWLPAAHMRPGVSARSHATLLSRVTAAPRATRARATPSSAARSVSSATNRAMVSHAAAHARVSPLAA